MSKLSRREFLNFLGLASIPLWPFSKFNKKLSFQRHVTSRMLYDLLIEKRNSINSISFIVYKKLIFVDPEIRQDPNRDIPPMDTISEFYFNNKYLKIVFYFPTEKTPDNFGAKFTFIWKENQKYQKREALDGSFRTEYLKRRLSSYEKNNLFSYLEDLLAMPNNTLMTLDGTEFINGTLTYIITQGNSKYWISPEKCLVLRKEIYRDSNTLQKSLEYKNIKEFEGKIALPTLVFEKHFNATNKLVEEYRKDIRNVKINGSMPEDIFYVEEEKYIG